MEKTKLNAKDFITIGIVSAIGAVLFMVIGTLMGTTPIGWVFMHSALAIPLGILYMLLYSRVPKKGVVLLGGLIFILLQLMNNWIIPSIMLVIFIINEIIWSFGSQKKFSKMVVAFTIMMTGWAAASFAPILVLKDRYIVQFGDRAAYFEQAYNVLAGPIGLGVLAGVIVASILGAFLGRAILKKHFEKAGIV